MFICGICHHSSLPNEKAVHVVTEARVKHYPFRAAAHFFHDRDGLPVVRDDPGGFGYETVHEVLAHFSCATLTTAHT